MEKRESLLHLQISGYVHSNSNTVHSIVSLGIIYKKLSYRWQTSRRV